MEKNINDWCKVDSKDTVYYRTDNKNFIFSVDTDDDGGLITLHNNGKSVHLDSIELSRIGFRRMYCDELIRKFFEN